MHVIGFQDRLKQFQIGEFKDCKDFEIGSTDLGSRAGLALPSRGWGFALASLSDCGPLLLGVGVGPGWKWPLPSKGSWPSFSNLGYSEKEGRNWPILHQEKEGHNNFFNAEGRRKEDKGLALWVESFLSWSGIGPSFSGCGLAHPCCSFLFLFKFSLFLHVLLLLAYWFCFLFISHFSLFAMFHPSSFLIFLSRSGTWPFLLGTAGWPFLLGCGCGPFLLGVGVPFLLGLGLALPSQRECGPSGWGWPFLTRREEGKARLEPKGKGRTNTRGKKGQPTFQERKGHDYNNN